MNGHRSRLRAERFQAGEVGAHEVEFDVVAVGAVRPGKFLGADRHAAERITGNHISAEGAADFV